MKMFEVGELVAINYPTDYSGLTDHRKYGIVLKEFGNFRKNIFVIYDVESQKIDTYHIHFLSKSQTSK